MSAHLKALSADPHAFWGLAGLGLLYGVFHAAGPGHGKAVIASYMMASDRAVKRGVVLAFLAALVQGAVAIALVSVAALVFNATAREMNIVADSLARLSYLGIGAIGAWLVWRKGRALIVAAKAFFARRAAIAGGVAVRRRAVAAGAGGARRRVSRRSSRRRRALRGGLRPLARSRSQLARGRLFLARRAGDRRRRGLAALLGSDPGAGLCARAGRLSRRDRRRPCYFAGHRSDDRRARFRRCFRQVDFAASGRRRSFAR